MNAIYIPTPWMENCCFGSGEEAKPFQSNGLHWWRGKELYLTALLKYLGDKKLLGSPFQINFPRLMTETFENLTAADPSPCPKLAVTLMRRFGAAAWTTRPHIQNCPKLQLRSIAMLESVGFQVYVGDKPSKTKAKLATILEFLIPSSGNIVTVVSSPASPMHMKP